MILSLTVLVIVLLLSPVGQYAINSWLKSKFINDFEVDFSVESLFVNPIGTTSFTDLLIRDHQNDTLVFVDYFSFESYHLGGLVSSKLHLGDVTFDSLFLNVVKYKNENKSNLDIFIEKVNTDEARIKQLSANSININHSKLRLTDLNKADSSKQIFSSMNAKLVDFNSHSNDFSTHIQEMSFFANYQNIQVLDLKAFCSFNFEGAEFKNLKIITPNSQLNSDIVIRYNEERFQNFYDNVSFDFLVQDSFLGLHDIQFLGLNLPKSETIFLDQLAFSGTPNQFSIDIFSLNYEKSKLLGSFTFNAPSTSKLTIHELYINPNDIQNLFLNLDQSSVDVLKRFGKANISGTLASQSVNHKLNLLVDSRLGPLQFNFDLFREGRLNSSFYDGQINASQFNIGDLLNQNSLGTTDLSLFVKGKGLQFDQLDTKLLGQFSSLSYGENKLDTISVNINLNKSRVVGSVNIDDSDAKLQIQGQFEANDSVQKFSAIAKVIELKLQSIQSSQSSTNRMLSGNFEIVGQGTQIDNFIGDINAESVQIRSRNKLFSFEDFSIQSRVNKDLRFFNIISKDVINGLVYGRFEFSDLNKMIMNSFGSYFSSYKPLQLEPHKFVNFSINLKNKLLNALSDDITVDDNSFFRGKLSANVNEANLQFDVPYIKYEDKVFSQLRLTLDNDNPLYKSFLYIKEFQGIGLSFSKFQLINTVINDRLHFRAEYQSNSFHNEVNFYSTLDKNQEVEIGIQPSKISYQNKQWKVNQLDDITSSLSFSSKGLKLDSTVFSNDESVLYLSFDQQKHTVFKLFLRILIFPILLSLTPRET